MEGYCTMKFHGLCVSLFFVLVLPLPAKAQDRRQDSVASTSATPGTLSLSLKDVVDRAVKNNLAVILGSEEEKIADAKRLQDRAELYPKIEGFLAAAQQQINLASFGFTGFPGIQPIVGPFNFIDARATFTQSVLDFQRRHDLRESSEDRRAAAFTNANTRELVVLTAVDLYFQVVSSQSRVTATEAQLSRAKTLYERAVDLKSAGVVPGIDVLRAEVEQRMVEQRLIQARNLVQKDKLALARAIGLSLDQEFSLADGLPLEGQAMPSRDELLALAYDRRSDALAVEARIRAAEEEVKAARAKGLPKVKVAGDYGANGPSPTNAHGTYSMRVEVRMPIFDKTIDSDALEKEALLRQRHAERDSLHGRIEMDVRSALLDVDSTAEQLLVARRSLTLAQQQLDQAQDRFTAGVANNLEVVQAQEAVALANEGVIQGLYGFNIARALLGRATGSAERSISEFFPGSLSK
jgi:outer membrane protein TolC